MNRLTLYARQQQARLEQQSEVVRHAGRRNGYCLQMLVAGFLVECFGNEQKLLYPPDFFPSRKNANTDLYFISQR